jgi:crotonobetainyl-CoA:carnitine CoA-transferase CaiB-like acyl-CoA transferase
LSKILDGLKVLEVGQGVSAPFCGLMLSDMGADVLKIEPPGQGDISHQWGPPFIGFETAYYLSMNRNKKNIVLNLKDRTARQIFLKLCEKTDVLIENFRPGVMMKFGLGYQDLKEINPKIIYCSISGYGQDGPAKDEHAFDLVIQARSGLMDITGADEPAKVGIPIIDIGAGMYAAYSISLALLKRQVSGVGDYIDIALLDTAVSWLCYYITGSSYMSKTNRRLGTAHQTIAPYQLFRASDGYIAIAASTDDLWNKMCKGLELESLLSDARFKTNADRVRNRSVLVDILNVTLKVQTRVEIQKRLKIAGVPCEPYQTTEEVISDGQVEYRKMILKLLHPKLGEIIVPGCPIKFQSSYNEEDYRAPAERGQDTDRILRGLGYSIDEIRDLRSKNVVA